MSTPDAPTPDSPIDEPAAPPVPPAPAGYAPPAYTPPPTYAAPPAYAPPAATEPPYAAAPPAQGGYPPPPAAAPYPSAPPAYGAPAPAYGYGYPQARKTNTLAIVSMIASIVGFLWILPFIGSLAGAIMGHISLKQIAQSGEGGRGMALAGVIVGWVGLGIVVIAGIAFLIFFFAVAASSGVRYS